LDERAGHIRLDVDLHLLAAERTGNQKLVRHVDKWRRQASACREDFGFTLEAREALGIVAPDGGSTVIAT
jgi:hypothetical protein